MTSSRRRKIELPKVPVSSYMHDPFYYLYEYSALVLLIHHDIRTTITITLMYVCTWQSPFRLENNITLINVPMYEYIRIVRIVRIGTVQVHMIQSYHTRDT